MLRWALAVALVTGISSTQAPQKTQTPPLQHPSTVTALGSWSGLASWYGGKERLNKHVAMGHKFNPEAMEAAMWDVPLGSTIRVTNLENGRSVTVRVTDRGPSRRLRNRVVDLTRRSFAQLAPLGKGLISVRVERLS
jgi:rare lipoprotein A